MNLDADHIRDHATGLWVSTIYPALGIDFVRAPHIHQPCPVCGGSDRFRCDDKQGRGTWICSNCGAGDGFALVQNFTSGDFADALKAVAGVLGISEGKQLTDSERKKIREKAEQRRAAAALRKTQAQKLGAEQAEAIWAQDKSDHINHAYVIAKNVAPYRSSMSLCSKKLFIPMHHRSGRLCNIQTITMSDDGSSIKRFIKGAIVTGLFCNIGFIINPDKVPKQIVICEGWATGCTLYEATELPVAVAFNAGNLYPVARALRKLFGTGVKLIFAADNDAAKAAELRQRDINKGVTPKDLDEYNTGLYKARQAADEVGGFVIVPDFEPVSGETSGEVAA